MTNRLANKTGNIDSVGTSVNWEHAQSTLVSTMNSVDTSVNYGRVQLTLVSTKTRSPLKNSTPRKNFSKIQNPKNSFFAHITFTQEQYAKTVCR